MFDRLPHRASETPYPIRSASPPVDHDVEELCRLYDRRLAERVAAELARWNIDRRKAGAWAMIDVMRAMREFDALGALKQFKGPATVIIGAKGKAQLLADLNDFL